VPQHLTHSSQRTILRHQSGPPSRSLPRTGKSREALSFHCAHSIVEPCAEVNSLQHLCRKSSANCSTCSSLSGTASAAATQRVVRDGQFGGSRAAPTPGPAPTLTTGSEVPASQ